MKDFILYKKIYDTGKKIKTKFDNNTGEIILLFKINERVLC